MEVSVSSGAPGYAFYGQNKITVAVDMTQAAWNTVAGHRLFTITGVVAWKLFPLTRTTLGSGGAATIQLGDFYGTNFIIAATAVAVMTGPDSMWTGAGGSAARGAQTAPAPYVGFSGNSANIGYEILAAAMNAGTMEFTIFWTPVSTNGNIVAATGGAL